MSAPPRLLVAPSPVHGVGCFAAEPIPAGALLSFPIVMVGSVAREDPKLCRYLFPTVAHGAAAEDVGPALARLRSEAPRDFSPSAFVVGPVAFCNHSSDPNLRDRSLDAGPPATKTFVVLRDVAAGEELTLRYLD